MNRALFALACLLAEACFAAAIPVKQSIELWIDPSQATFEGEVRIEVVLDKPSDAVWLNAKELDITEAFVASARAQVEVTEEALGLHVSKPIAGRTQLRIRYRAKADDKST